MNKRAGKNHDHLVWEETSREKVFDGPIFDLFRVHRTASNGKEGNFILLDSPDWVNVIPLLKDPEGRDCFLMVRQYRQGSQTVTLEFPGGVIDRGEAPEAAAARELLEETGYRAGKTSFAGKISPNPAYQDNWAHTYIAEDLHRISEQELDEHEIVDFELVPVEEVERDMGTGPHIHAIMMAALGFYQRWKAGE